MEEGITPLEVLLRAMRGYANSQQWDRATANAKDAASHLHPKLSSVEPPEKEPPKNAPDFSAFAHEQLELRMPFSQDSLPRYASERVARPKLASRQDIRYIE